MSAQLSAGVALELMERNQWYFANPAADVGIRRARGKHTLLKVLCATSAGLHFFVLVTCDFGPQTIGHL